MNPSFALMTCGPGNVLQTVERLLENAPEFFARFTVVVATQLHEASMLALAAHLLSIRVPLLVVRSYGLVGHIRIALHEHPGWYKRCAVMSSVVASVVMLHSGRGAP